jgi:zinc protease
MLAVVVSGHAFCQTATPSVSKMGNGLTAVLLEDHAAPLVGVDVWVKAGSGRETVANNGVSHFIEHLVFGATAKREPGQMDLEMESIGAALDARTSKDWAHFSTTVSSRYLAKALDVLADAVSSARFREQDIDAERLVILDEIAKKEADPRKVCTDYLAAEIYGKHSYALPIEGTGDSIRKITRQEIVDYYQANYTPGNIAVSLVGDFDPQKAMVEIGRAFQGRSAAAPPASPPVEIPAISEQVNKTLPSKFKSYYLAIGFLGPKSSDSGDVCATDVLLSYLGIGYRTWMAEELRDKQKLVTDASADYLTQREPGLISLVAATTADNLDKTKAAIFDQLAAIRKDGIPQDSLSVAKRSLLGVSAFQNETYGGLANWYGFYWAAGDVEFATKYMPAIQSVTNDDIIRVAKKYLDPQHAVVLVLKPEGGGSQ